MSSSRKSSSFSRADLPRHFFTRFLPETRVVALRRCEHPGCEGVGEHKAPGRRYREERAAAPLNIIDERREQATRWFCLDHVKAYNETWDYYEGLGEEEMEAAIRFDTVWNRPSWPFGQWGPKRGPRPQARGPRKFSPGPEEEVKSFNAASSMEAAREALLELGLEPPVDFGKVKRRYHELVKRHHPDVSFDAAGDRIKRLNAAFTLLKSLYRKGR
ncbi:MAG: J domain-containing protein [Proteobacteria bacterium]|nr:J domain-containing protein [Pseudomonadota bacterium]